MRLKEAFRRFIGSILDLYPPNEAESIARIVLEHLGFSRKEMHLNPDLELDDVMEAKLIGIQNELLQNRPIQYIIGKTEFFGLTFIVNENVLIPRQETELLVSMVISDAETNRPVILDLGTGSGCIAITLAKNLPGAKVYATDVSAEALKIAEQNASMNRVKISLIYDDILDSRLGGDLFFDYIISNPPYVMESEKKMMHLNILNYEPESALFVPDENPFLFYRPIIQLAKNRLNKKGKIYVEINEQFAGKISEIMKEAGFADICIIRDIYEKDRIIRATLP